MSDQECKHGLTEATCALCKHPPRPRTVAGTPFLALYAGPCKLGRDDIDEGELIVMLSDGTYAHNTCAVQHGLRRS